MIRFWRFFGLPTAEDHDGRTVALTAQATRLFAALVSDAPQPTLPARLAERVAGADDEAGRGALRVAVSRCRTAYGKEHIVTVAGHYRFAAPRSDVDLWRYDDLLDGARDVRRAPSERLAMVERALSLRTGPPFAAIDVDEEWLADLVAYFDERQRSAEELWARLKIDLGQHESAVERLQQFVLAEPMREQRWELLMEALARSGRRTEALEAFDRLGSTLAHEIGTAPSAGSQRLAERIDRDDPEVCRRGATPLRLQIAPAASSLIGVDELVERAIDLTRRHRAVSIVGLGGLGKTQIALATMSRLGRPAAFVDLGTADGIRDVLDRLSSAVGSQPSTDLQLTMAALVDKLRRRELTVVVDACEGAAGDVASLLGTLLASCPDLNVLITSRVPVPVDGVVELRPTPLALGTAHDPGPGAVLLADHAGIPMRELAARWPTVAEIHERAGGLPLALIMLGSSWAMAPDEPPPRLARGVTTPGIDDVARGVVDHLGPAMRSSLLAMSLLPDGFVARHLARQNERPLEDALFDLRVARSLGLVQARTSVEQPPGGNSWYRFPDPVRESLVAMRSAKDERAFWDRYANDMLAELQAVRHSFIGRVSGPAAQQLQAHGTNVSAAVHTCSSADRSVDLGSAMVACWSAVGSSTAAWRLLESLDSLDGLADRSRAMLALMRVTIVGSFAQRALHLPELEAARALAAASGDRDLELRLMTEIAIGRGWSGDGRGSVDLLEEMRAEVLGAPDPWTQIQYSVFVAIGDVLAGRVDVGIATLVELAGQFVALDDSDSAMWVLAMVGTFLRRFGDLHRAERVLRSAVEEHGPSVSNRHGLASATHELALVARARSQSDATALLAHAVEMLDEYGEHRTAAVARRDLGIQLLDQGDVHLAIDHLRQAMPMLLRVDTQSSAAALAALAQAARRCGQAELASTLASAANHRRAQQGGLPLSADESTVFDGLPPEAHEFDESTVLDLVDAVGEPQRRSHIGGAAR